MKSILSIAAVMLLSGSAAVAKREYPVAALQYRQWGALVYSGCYSSSEGSTKNTSLPFNSKGGCQTICLPTGAAVLSVQDTDCWCGNELPPKDSKVDDSKCSGICPGYGVEKCGADGYWTVYLTSTQSDVPNADSSDSAQSSAAAESSSKSAAAAATATSSAQASVVTIGGQTVIVTAPANASSTGGSSSSSSGGGPNKAGIAAGIVVGVVSIAAIAGGIFLFLRHRRNRAVEEEYRRNAAVSSFISGGKSPSSSDGASSFDTRLDPVMAQRRMSDGSIADNQDYSRRILKVTNA